jgi:hypothetical protein
MRTTFPAYLIHLHMIILINYQTASNPRIQWSNPPVVFACFSITCSSNKITYREFFPTKKPRRRHNGFRSATRKTYYYPCRIWGSHSGGYENIYLLGYNVV